MKYNRSLMMAILHDRIKIADAVNVELIPLEQAPEAYQSFDSGVPKKFVIDPHHMVPAEARMNGESGHDMRATEKDQINAALMSFVRAG
jgi:hypothetical protein